MIYTSWERSLTSRHWNQSMIFPFSRLVGYGRTLPREGIIITTKLGSISSPKNNQTKPNNKPRLEESDLNLSVSSLVIYKTAKGTIAKSINLKNFTEKLSMANSKPLSGRLMFSRRRFVNGSRNLKGISQMRKPWDWNIYLNFAIDLWKNNSRYTYS